MQEEILTSRFSIQPSVHAKLALARRSARFWMAITLPLLLLIIAGALYDTRLYFVAAAVTFILFPTLLLIAWNTLLTRPAAINAMFPQTILFNRDDEISVRYYPLPSSSSDSSSSSSSSDSSDSHPFHPSHSSHSSQRSCSRSVSSEDPNSPDELIIQSQEVTDCRLYGNYINLIYGPGNDLLIPLSALPSPETATVILQRYARPLV